MAVFIPDIFSGYLNGIRQANQDNWTDATNYNKVLQGQMQNAYNMATFDPSVRQEWNNAAISDMNTLQNNLTTRRAANQYALNKALGIDEASAQAQAQAIARGDISAAMKLAQGQQNYGIAQQYGQEKADLQMQALRNQLEQQKATIAMLQAKANGTATTSTNPYTIGTNLGGTTAQTTVTQPTVTQPAIVPEDQTTTEQEQGVPMFVPEL